MAAPALVSVSATRLASGEYAVRLTYWPEVNRPPRVVWITSATPSRDELASVLSCLSQAAYAAALDASATPHVAL